MATYPISRYTEAGLLSERLYLPSRKSSSDLPLLASWDEFCKSWLSNQNITPNQFPTLDKPIPVLEFFSSASPADIARLKSFVQKGGGPDLSNLRGYSRKTTSFSCPNTIDLSTVTSKTKRSSTAYGRGFEQSLINHGIYLNNRAKTPHNIEEIKERLAEPRHTLSPSKFSERLFNKFQHDACNAKDEDDIMIDVIPAIHGKQKNHFYARTTKFGNLELLMAGSPVAATPDLYYGARPDELHRNIRDQLNKHIIPATMEDKPMALNFFLEVKGPDGMAVVAQRQACYAWAIGARGMLSLQLYGLDKVTYDNCAHTIISTYYDGMLKMYATHITAPTSANKPPDYHMTLLGAWALIGSREQFQQGAVAFRNSRDWVKERRDGFISIVNKKNGPSSLESARYSCPIEPEITCLKGSEISAGKLTLLSISVPYPVEEPQNSVDKLSLTSFSQAMKGNISCNDLSLTKDAKLKVSKKHPTSKKRPTSKISLGAFSKDSKDSKNKKVYRGAFTEQF